MKVRFSRMQQIAGVFVILALTIILFSSVYIIKDKKLFVSMIDVYTNLLRGDGISTTTKVVYKGIDVGYVNDMQLADNNRIKVHMKIYPEFWKHFRGFTYVKIVSGSIIGGKQLELIPEDKGAPLEKGSWLLSENDERVKKMLEGGQIKGKEQDMNKKIMSILSDVEVIIKNVKKMTIEMQQDNSDYKKILVNVRNITGNVAKVTEVLAKTSPEIKQMVVDSQSAIKEANRMVKATQKSGLFKMLTPSLKDPKEHQRLMHLDTRDL